jgi:quercetin dioxygenase-like cupin family protein
MSDEEKATGYVIGTLEAAERESLRRRLVEDRGFADLVDRWEERLAPLALGAAADLPEGILERIEARIDASGVELPGTLTRRAGTGEWTEVSPGLRIKILNRIEAQNRQTFMAWLEPGTEYVDHDHDQDEEIFMVEGDLLIGELELRAGDFHVARAGRHHPVHRTRGGCICIISQAIGPL